jgi:hypothetical protein
MRILLYSNQGARMWFWLIIYRRLNYLIYLVWNSILKLLSGFDLFGFRFNSFNLKLFAS